LAQSRTKQSSPLGPFLYLWLALSMLLNVAGVASIVDGLVHWAIFFKDFLNIYRVWIRGPISWAAHIIWPASWPKIPTWGYDLLVIWSAVFLAANICWLKRFGKTTISYLIDRHGIPAGILRTVVAFVTFPFFLAKGLTAPSDATEKRLATQTSVYFLILISAVIVLAFLNWQLRHLGH
jgi:hypothetical protein